MTTDELLKEYRDRELNSVFSYSANYLMNSPRKGYEKEFEAAQMRAELLQALIMKLRDEAQQPGVACPGGCVKSYADPAEHCADCVMGPEKRG
ncbi:MAG: hypothetical protein VB078_07030 [Clostridiaceae bacterium]|nr:hypothetical protein [Clostridiaceae bacterium]